MADQNRIEQIFTDAVLCPLPERDAYLEAACGADDALKQRVKALLAAHQQAEHQFLSLPSDTGAATVDFHPAPEMEGPGTRIGHYKLLQTIGEGGMGIVYMAEQEEPVRRRVALKIIKPGMDTRQVIARFEAERQALALMNHPNIAMVFDAGATHTGRPFFVMELVKGVPITEYCDKNNLDTTERLHLFVGVCNAVQHAHQKGVIHRDIKPSNVLVTLHDGKPVPKVIDFGIAKATNQRLTEKTVFTEYQQFIGTPAYTSPEQAEMSGLDVDTRSDIYSLGVLLYELLTGGTPFDGSKLRAAAYAEIQRIIREVEPPRPSVRLSTMGESLTAVAKHRSVDPAQLSKQVRGDLDCIVMKCLEKDRTRRYDAVDALLADFERYLSGMPVGARPQSVAYRARKFFRRHKLLVFFSLAFSAALACGGALAVAGFLEARRQAAIAREQADTANRVVAYLKQTLGAADVSRSRGVNYTVLQMLGDLGDIDTLFGDRADVAADLHLTVGEAYASLRDYKNAEAHLHRALDLREARFGSDSDLYADVLIEYATNIIDAAPQTELQKHIAMARRAIDIYHARGMHGTRVIHALAGLLLLLNDDREFPSVEATAEEARKEAALTPGVVYPDLNILEAELTDVLMLQHKVTQAESLARASLERSIAAHGPKSAASGWEYLRLGGVLCAERKYPEAFDDARAALEAFSNSFPASNIHLGKPLDRLHEVLYDASVDHCLKQLAVDSDQLAQVERLFRPWITMTPLEDNKYDPVNAARGTLADFPFFYRELAAELNASGQSEAARESASRADALEIEMRDILGANPDVRAISLKRQMGLARSLGLNGKADELEDQYIGLAGALTDSLPMCDLAYILLEETDPTRHRPELALDLARRCVATSNTIWEFRDVLGMAEYQTGHFAEARDALETAIQLNQPGDQGRTLCYLAMTEEKLGHHAAALEDYHQAINDPRKQKLGPLFNEVAHTLNISPEPSTTPTTIP